MSLVDHTDANFVKTDTDDKDNIVIKWSNGGTVNLRAGELKGLLELYKWRWEK